MDLLSRPGCLRLLCAGCLGEVSLSGGLSFVLGLVFCAGIHAHVHLAVLRGRGDIDDGGDWCGDGAELLMVWW